MHMGSGGLDARWRAAHVCCTEEICDCVAKNEEIFLTMEVVGTSAFFVPFTRILPTAFMASADAPGLRPAPGRQPPLRPLAPAMPLAE